jgi:hypothetical protein
MFAFKFSLRRYMEVGDANGTTNVMIAIEPAHALVAGKQKMSCLVLQTRKGDKRAGVVMRREPGRALQVHPS